MTLLLNAAAATEPGEVADAPDSQHAQPGTSAWGASRITLVQKGKKLDRGLALYTTNDEQPGVAFRCHRRKLYAFVSVKPVSFRKLLAERFRNPAEWQVEYRVDGGDTNVESWIWTYDGKVFMSRPGKSAVHLFHASLRGASIAFRRKHGDPVSIDVPPGNDGLFGRFLDGCEINVREPGSTSS